jgi:hypothetical protein
MPQAWRLVKLIKMLPTASLALLSHSKSNICPGRSGGPDYRVDPQDISLFEIKRSDPKVCDAGFVVNALVTLYEPTFYLDFFLGKHWLY